MAPLDPEGYAYGLAHFRARHTHDPGEAGVDRRKCPGCSHLPDWMRKPGDVLPATGLKTMRQAAAEAELEPDDEVVEEHEYTGEPPDDEIPF